MLQMLHALYISAVSAQCYSSLLFGPHLPFSHTESTLKAPLRDCLSLSSTDVCDGDRLLFLRALKHIQTSTQKWSMLSAILLCQCRALTLSYTVWIHSMTDHCNLKSHRPHQLGSVPDPWSQVMSTLRRYHTGTARFLTHTMQAYFWDTN